jgi:hypothetical protein
MLSVGRFGAAKCLESKNEENALMLSATEGT